MTYGRVTLGPNCVTNMYLRSEANLPMDINVVNQRVDKALADNQRDHNIVLLMAVAIFALGVIIILVAYKQENPYVATGALVAQLFLYWPVREILRLRRENLMLQTLPSLVSTLAPDAAAREIAKLLAYLRGKL